VLCTCSLTNPHVDISILTFVYFHCCHIPSLLSHSRLRVITCFIWHALHVHCLLHVLLAAVRRTVARLRQHCSSVAGILIPQHCRSQLAWSSTTGAGNRHLRVAERVITAYLWLQCISATVHACRPLLLLSRVLPTTLSCTAAADTLGLQSVESSLCATHTG
jgi:hypothetical protein